MNNQSNIRNSTSKDNYTFHNVTINNNIIRNNNNLNNDRMNNDSNDNRQQFHPICNGNAGINHDAGNSNLNTVFPRKSRISPRNARPHLYKTELCSKFQHFGWCPYNESCQFAHGVTELREKPTFYDNKVMSLMPIMPTTSNVSTPAPYVPFLYQSNLAMANFHGGMNITTVPSYQMPNSNPFQMSYAFTPNNPQGIVNMNNTIHPINTIRAMTPMNTTHSVNTLNSLTELKCSDAINGSDLIEYSRAPSPANPSVINDTLDFPVVINPFGSLSIPSSIPNVSVNVMNTDDSLLVSPCRKLESVETTVQELFLSPFKTKDLNANTDITNSSDNSNLNKSIKTKVNTSSSNSSNDSKKSQQDKFENMDKELEKINLSIKKLKLRRQNLIQKMNQQRFKMYLESSMKSEIIGDNKENCFPL